ncbi:myb-related transcription factor, partner of profilin-like isoform X2 [Anguilla anguilla]|uniref:myb-related transcription factor, partner of profilin-like isoform X2 n=1 Tax=Anguilla anguilla TaxID=7936 RepID=UPI0015B2EA76|nr:myb-related transcription factor, partner of profilin-like isoform X2 [Anguilla anguilla]
MESNYPVITNVFDTDWCNHLWGDTNPASARAKGVTMESRHVNLQQGGSEPAYVSFKNEPEHRELLMQEVHIPSETPVVGNSSVYPLQPGGLQNSSKNAVNQRDLQGLHFHTNSDSRRSRARFSREEERALLAGVVERWDELYGYQSQALPRGAKSRIWSDIAARLSASSREARDGEDVRKKWLYIKLTLRNRLRSAGQLGLGAGAGAYPPDLSPLEQRVLALLGHDSGGSVDAPDIGFGPVSGEDFRPLALHGPEDLDTVGSTSDTEMDGSHDEPPEEPAPPPFLTAPASVPSPVPVSTTASASGGPRRSARPEDPLAPALAAIRSRQDRSISLYQEAIGVLRSLAADVRRRLPPGFRERGIQTQGDWGPSFLSCLLH